MIKLIYTMNYSVYPHQGAMLDKLVEEKEKGHDIYWAYCCGALSSCFPNLNGNKASCKFCHFMNNEFRREYGEGVHILPINRKYFLHTPRNFEYLSVNDIKNIKYRNVEIGNSILSVLISTWRNLDISIDNTFRVYFDQLANEICDLTDYIYELIEKIKPDEIIIQNGRLFEHRMFYDIAKAKGIHYVSVEVIGGYGEDYKRVSFDNTLPHSIINRTNIINRVWTISKDSYEEREKIAYDFYSKKRGGKLIADVKAYTTNQIQGLLPNGFDRTKRNVAIFNSSTDEIAAVGGEWEEDKLFECQYDAIEFLLQKAPNDIHFYLRIHPNMEKVTYHDHIGLYELPNKYSNITVIEPTSKISSYAVLDACEEIIVFGSTMGIEACYWGKPSILIGKSFYMNMDVCYCPKTKEDIINLLLLPLKPKEKIGAIKYAYYLLDRKYQIESYKYVEYNILNKSLLGIKIRYVPYLKVFRSIYIFKIVHFIFNKLFKSRSSIAYQYPH